MAQSSMLELLAVTDAAVKGLDRTRSSSASSRSSRGSARKSQQNDSPSRDSGICKTNTVTGDVAYSHQMHESDESTTASDVLITSTTVDPDQRSFLAPDGGNLSNVSKCSKMSIGSENFNTAGATKVKISAKRLREIKSPFSDEISPRSEDGGDKVPVALRDKNPPLKGADKAEVALTSKTDDKNFSKNAITKPMPSKTGKSRTQSAPRGLSEYKNGHSKDDDHFFSPLQTATSEMFEEFSPRDEGKEHIQKKSKTSTVPYGKTSSSKTQDPHLMSKEKAIEVLIERHTPKKMGPHEKRQHVEEVEDGYGKDPTLDLSGSVDLGQKEEDVTPVLGNSYSSRDSSQPEIFTVPERIVTVSARTSLSSAASVSDVGTSEQEDEKVPPMLPTRFQTGPKMNAGILRQGAPVDGASRLDEKQSPDVRISNFRMSEKQRQIRKNFAKKYEQPGPVKRVVQPRIVGADKKGSNVKDEGSKVSGQNSEAIAVAVAASAAVAATQPFLKAQQDLESKMAQMLEKMAQIQSESSSKKPISENQTTLESQKVMELEKQVSYLTEQRIEHLERLQEHQLQMQAKLISMTRATPQSRAQSSSLVRTPPQERKFPTPGVEPPKKAFSKTTINNRNSASPKGQKQTSEYPGSPLDTPAPRSRAPKPVAYDSSMRNDAQPQQSKGILEEILASAGSPPQAGSGLTIHPPIYTRYTDDARTRSRSKSPNVKKAEKLVEELSELKNQMTDLVSDVQKSSSNVRTDKIKTVETTSTPAVTAEELHGPAPLDPYLVLPDVVPTSPYKSVPNLSPQKFNAPVKIPPAFQDARQVLQQVGKNKEFLEANLESVLRARQEVEVYSLLENLYQESSGTEKAKLQQKVNDWVTNLREQVDREVTDEVILQELQKKHQKPIIPTKVPHVVPKETKQSYRSTVRGTAGARIDTGLKRDVAKTSVSGPSLTKIPGPSMGKAPRFGASKENKTAAKRPPAKRHSPESDQYLSRVYGKAAYENKRTTVKDPYLHYQNVPRQRSPGRPSPARDVPGIEVKSAKTQTKGGVKQFYFSPATGSFVPVASVSSAAPISGQLIPMAVPLGGPRMEGGLTVPVTVPSDSGPVTSTPMSHPQVTASKNVALVSLPSGEDEEQVSPQPELGKQVLPPVDIDTDISEESVVKSKSGNVHLKSPSKTHFEVTFHEDHPHEATPKDWRTQATMDDLSDEDLSPETAPGLALPGYCAPSPPPAPVEIPAFPPMVAGMDKLMQASDLIAADIRRRDLLENKATEWIEQEIMAHMISELYPMKPEKPREMDHVVHDETEESIADDKEQSMFMMDAIGRDGLQMFVDMGQPVDNRLVDALIKEVLLEKVTTMLGQKPDDETTIQKEVSEGRTTAKVGTSVGAYDADRVNTGISPEEEYDNMLKTPEPTPKASPISSPVRVLSPPVTPPDSPMVEKVPKKAHFVQEPRVVPLESEPEDVTESLDISEEIKMLRDKLVPVHVDSVQDVYDAVTPVPTPVPEPPQEEERPLSPPPPSPRRPEPVLQVPAAPAPVVPPPQPIKEEEKEMTQNEIVPEPVTSPQPWGNPESPVPEENPDFREDYIDDKLDQHKPYALSVAPTDESLRFPHGQELLPSPPPKSPIRRRSPSPSPSETETTSIMSSVSDTYNMSVSEGQWLLSKSEGEVADFQLDDATLRKMAAAQVKGDVSTASTLRDTDDLEDEATDLQASEGEFQYKGLVPPEKDPMLLLLSRLQRHPPQFGEIPSGFPVSGQFDMTSNQVHDLLNHTGRSSGEVFMNGASVHKSHGEVIQVLQSQRSIGEVLEYDQPVRDTNVNRQVNRSNDLSSRNGSPLRMTDLRGQSIQEELEPEPTQDYAEGDRQAVQDQPTMLGEAQSTPSRDGRPQSSRGRQSPARGGITVSPGGITVAAGGRTPAGKSAMRKPPQATPSSGLPNKTVSTTIPRTVQIRESDDNNQQESKQSIDGGATMSDQGTRTFTPDQMTMDDLIKSGYLTQSKSGEFGQSGGSYGYSQSGRLSQSYDQSSAMSQSLDNKNGTRDSTDSYVARQMNKGKSLGLTYSMEESLAASDSLDESELRQLATTGTLKMSVRMPAIGVMEDDSEFDITDGNTM